MKKPLNTYSDNKFPLTDNLQNKYAGATGEKYYMGGADKYLNTVENGSNYMYNSSPVNMHYLQ
jgi:hypothetical protein